MNKIFINQHMYGVNNATTKVGEFFFNGNIVSNDWWDEAISPKKIANMLEEMSDVTLLKLHINSNGGSVTAGNTIINLLRNFKVKTKATIEAYVSWGASMGSQIPCVADKVYMYENALQFFHKPLSIELGNANDMRKAADDLDKFEDTIIANYMNKFNGTEEELRDILANDTYMTAKECLEVGFCDEILTAMDAVASADFTRLILNGVSFENKEMIEMYKNKIGNLKIKESEEKNKMKFNQKLTDVYGISEETFNTITDVSALLSLIEVKNSESLEELKTSYENKLSEQTQFIDKAKVLETLSVEDVTEEEVIALVVKGQNAKEIDPNIENKATQFDKVKANLVKNTLEMGVKAMGAEIFDAKTWETTFETMNYDNIEKMCNAWEAQAKIALNAGGRKSEPKDYSNAKGRRFNPETDKI